MRLTDNDKKWGPFIWARWTKSFAVYYETSGDDEDDNREFNFVRVIAFGWVLQVMLPCIIKPHKEKKIANWEAETVKRLGRDWYYNVHERIFGFSLSDMENGYDFLQVFYGRRTHDSTTDKVWSRHLPWKQWDCVRHSLYQPDGLHFATEERNRSRERCFDFFRQKEKCPASHFGFEDFDGELIVATCIIEEYEHRKGSGWFKWLRLFARPKIRRSLDLKFSAEVGPEKGSWKGGTTGHGIEMLPKETPKQAFERYCLKDHDQRGRSFKLRFIGPCKAPQKVEVAAK